MFKIKKVKFLEIPDESRMIGETIVSIIILYQGNIQKKLNFDRVSIIGFDLKLIKPFCETVSMANNY